MYLGSRMAKRCLDVGQDIVAVFNPDGDPDKAIIDPSSETFGPGKLAMRGFDRQAGQALHPPKAAGRMDESELPEEGPSGTEPTLEAQGEHPTAPPHLDPGDPFVRGRERARVVYPFDPAFFG